MKDYSKELAYIFGLIQACKNATLNHGLGVQLDIEGDKVDESFIKFVNRVEVMHEQMTKELVFGEHAEPVIGAMDMIEKVVDKPTARQLAGIANSGYINNVISKLCNEIESEAVMGNYSLETTSLSELSEVELKVVKLRIERLGFTFEIEQIAGCKDRVVIGWE